MLKPTIALTLIGGVTLQGFAQIDIDFHRRFQKLESERRFAAEDHAGAREMLLTLAEDSDDPSEPSA